MRMLQGRSSRHPPASAPALVASGLLGVVSGFQVALAAGVPWGVAAYGGSKPGVLPASLRRTSASAAVVYLGLAVVAGTRVASPVVRRRVFYSALPVMAVGAVVNLASTSFVERMIWTPVTAGLSAALWKAARHPSLD
jgi:hypothetical protein